MWSTDDVKACPIDVGFEILGKKFAALIIRDMISLNHTRFNQFLESIEGLRPKILSTRLTELEKSGLIERKIYDETPTRIEYGLTEKGKAVKPILDEMAVFTRQYCTRYSVKRQDKESTEELQIVDLGTSKNDS